MDIGKFPSSGGFITMLVTLGGIVLARSNWHQKEKVCLKKNMDSKSWHLKSSKKLEEEDNYQHMVE